MGPDNTDDQLREGQSLVQPLAEDGQTPFSPPSSQLEPTHQATDSATDIDSQQLYDEGLAGAAEASEPNAGNAVTDYNPEQDNRNAG